MLKNIQRKEKLACEKSCVDNSNHKCRCNYIVLFQGVGAKTNLQHFFQVNKTNRTEATTDVFLMLKMECSWFTISFE